MLRSFDLIMIAALIGGAAWTFKIKSDSEAALQRTAVLERRIELEREAIDLLRADWSLLTSPERLQKLVERYHDELKLEPLTAERIGAADEIPLKQQFEDDAAGAREAGAEVQADMATGSVDRKADR